MYFYTFLQPEIFDEAVSDGDDAIQGIGAILAGLLQNCFIAVFEDDRWGASVKEKLDGWPATLGRRRVKSILGRFRNRRRFLYCLTPDYTGTGSDLECMFAQAGPAALDLVLVVTGERDHPAPAHVTVTTRRTYYETAFEEGRSELAVDGKTCLPGEMDETDFLDFHFAKAVRHATEIHICDRVCGTSNLADNFEYTTRQLLVWLDAALAVPGHCKIVFHLGQPKGRGLHRILQELASCKTGRLSATAVEVCFYDESLPAPALPHQRFILTDQIALAIDRGLDFLDRRTARNRDSYISYQNREQAERLLAASRMARVSSHRV